MTTRSRFLAGATGPGEIDGGLGDFESFFFLVRRKVSPALPN